MGTNNVTVEIVDSVEQAPVYLPEFKPSVIDKFIIVCNGTEAGNCTVDVQFRDANGNKYIAMITGALLATVSDIIKAKDNGK